VHGGGFYLVEKQKWPEIMPRALHWFKWESMMTWLSGFFLLAVVYWHGAPLLQFGSDVSRAQGVAISAASLVGGYAGYRLIWKVMGQNELPGLLVCFAAVMGLAWGLTHVLSDRAVYLHVGAVFGTIMVSNVWMTIIPNQKKIMAITEAGGQPDHSLAAAAKRCSKHNTFMSVPLLFTMISNHYPITFASQHALAILAVLILLGFVAAKIIRDNL